jgi:hypothetical protein
MSYVAELYWCASDVISMPWKLLEHTPAMLKATHASRKFLKLDSSSDRYLVEHESNEWLNYNYSRKSFEMQYDNIRPMLILEELLQPKFGPLYDYKFWCFHGKPLVVHIDDPEQSINPFYDMKGNLLSLHYRQNKLRPIIPLPDNWKEMVDTVTTLCQGHEFVRLDMYNVDGRIVFGEYTFTPNAGVLKFIPDEWDLLLGKEW